MVVSGFSGHAENSEHLKEKRQIPDCPKIRYGWDTLESYEGHICSRTEASFCSHFKATCGVIFKPHVDL